MPSRTHSSRAPAPDKRPRPSGPRPRRQLYLLGGLLCLAAVLRIIYLWQFSTRTPFFDAPVVDAEMYDQMARRIAAGEWIGHQIFYQSPLYPYGLAVIYAIGGHRYLPVYILQGLLGLITLLLIYRLGKQIFNVTVALTAVVLSILYGPYLFYESKLLMATTATTVNLLLLWWLLRTSAAPTAGKWLLGGLLLGLAILIRGNMLFFLPLVLVWLYLIEKCWKIFSRRALAVLIGVVLAIAPVTIRNYLVGDDFVPIAAHTGITFYMGANPQATGTYTRVEGLSGVIQMQQEEERRLAEEALGRLLKPSQVSAYWQRKGLGYIRSHPLQYLRLEFKKAWLFFNNLELANNYNFYLERKLVPMLGLLFAPFALLSSLAIIGLWWGATKNRGTMLLAFYAAAYLVSLLAFFVLSRYRLPVVPALTLFAAYAGFTLVQTLRRAEVRRFTFGLAGVSLLLIITLYPVKEKNTMLGGAYATLGNVYADKGAYREALHSYSEALRHDPALSTVYNNMGNVYVSLHQLDLAEAAYEEAIKRDSTHSRAYFNLSMVSKIQGDPARAIKRLSQATAIDPHYAEAHYELGNAYRQLGRSLEAIDAYQRAIQLQPDLAEAFNNLGIVYLNLGRRDEALKIWRTTLQVRPNSEAAHTALNNIRAVEATADTSARTKEEESR